MLSHHVELVGTRKLCGNVSITEVTQPRAFCGVKFHVFVEMCYQRRILSRMYTLAAYDILIARPAFAK